MYYARLQSSLHFLLYAAVSIVWFATIVLLLSYVRKWLMSPRVQNVIDKATGFVLIGFGLNMIFRVQRTGH
ncbi:LysE family transporter [Paenibacillus polymyxa]|uniref:LysE family transporter n=1 Tax=Paenibacillus polymyxa TaxID=1406 RepID=A0AAE9LB01_PAEPO|nr:LysE family transporter [Paenibacillus polymyxa]